MHGSYVSSVPSGNMRYLIGGGANHWLEISPSFYPSLSTMLTYIAI